MSEINIKKLTHHISQGLLLIASPVIAMLSSVITMYRSTITILAPVIALLIPVTTIAADSVNPPAEITFLTWNEYISEDVVAEFENQFRAKVNFVYYESDDARDEMLMTYGIGGYDLILLDSVNIPFYQQLAWITAFNVSQAPNLNHVKLPVLSNLNKKDHTCAPYAWGSTGIAYRTDLVSEPITSWKQIFTPSSELQGKILMSTLSEEVVGMALKSLGYSMQSTSNQELEAARQLLLQQAPSVAGYSAIASISQKSKLISGEISAILTYSSDALMLNEIDPKIEYVLPEEGGAIWADFICLSDKASNPELAHQFINFINQPEQAATNATYIYSATPNLAAEKLLPADFLNDPTIYPDQALVANSETYKRLPPRTIIKHNTIMQELRNTLE